METSGVLREVEANVLDQIALAGGDPAVAAAGEALAAALRPALSAAVLSLVEQAAAEVRAQIADYDVDVVVRDGEPSILVRGNQSTVTFSTDEMEARMTLRLPNGLKADLESAAGASGDSINSYVVKALATAGRASRGRGRRMTGTFET